MDTNLYIQQRLAEDYIARRLEEARLEHLLRPEEGRSAASRPLRRLAAGLGAALVAVGERLRSLDDRPKTANEPC